MAEVKVWRGAEGVHVEGADWLTPEGVIALRDALAEHDPRVQDPDIHRWTVEPDGDGDVALWAWHRTVPQPVSLAYRPITQDRPGSIPWAVWRATLAGLGLRDVAGDDAAELGQ